jgi:YD repeat-containing protein
MKRLIERYGTGWIRIINDKGNPGGLDISYEYDANGNVLTYEQGGTQESFGYDVRNQLVTWIDTDGVPHSYTYDPAGNLTGKDGVAFTHDAANQITNAGFTHDPSGNLTSDGVMNYVYDTLRNVRHWPSGGGLPARSVDVLGPSMAWVHTG